MKRLDTPIQYVKGIGPKLAKLFGKLGVQTVEDLFYLIPRGYEDRRNIKPIGKLVPSISEVITGEIREVENLRNSVLKVKLQDPSGSITAVWFNQPFLLKIFQRGVKLILSGKVEMNFYDRQLQFVPRSFEIDTGDNLKIAPIYPLTEGLYPKKIRSIIRTTLDEYLDQTVDRVPAEIRAKYDLPDLKEAIRYLHLPEDMENIEKHRRRLVFDEFFFFQLELNVRREAVKKEPGIAFDTGYQLAVPFELTGAQKRVVEEIKMDMAKPVPMNRLIQGDVGSGKTIVSAIAAHIAISNGYQVALMAPTEILANQHYEKIIRIPGYQNIKVKLITGTTQRKDPSTLLGVDLIIGTHALIEKKIGFKKLGLVIIDEQHRFGVLQRAKLLQKGINPDLLFLTATPIPRSLALTLYGDLDRSIIDELPPGRTPIKTHYVSEGKRKNSYEFMRKELVAGRQIFVVCPLVEESEKIDLKAAMDEAENLQNNIFPEFKVGLLHGRMRGDEKDRVMRDFKDKKINVLVSTTVIEVGIDIPNASIMAVEHAERFGLSQLHQLRGRIGRGANQSYCFLFSDAKGENARARIKALLDSNDGFYIAEVDLKLRGPGDVAGIRQSGLPNFRAADIVKDEAILREASEAVKLCA
ncbi:ATP-dependent DNA helicase RecG [candidate division WOR-1 bacterium RIFOXYA12_FULL_43_27]|nr:MAG: ATP-dependent DNA helicase RecG [candidate division WOR-1 bacterium RIFOXYA12_FULL_43_27]OGC20135.1 MAG: ATP-dependent DNA helicase RecG [candidate division WOR-1 bacterium RIFOXYB2_FULL_46_45]OGC32128.1 MAG: ATP-dependent DNA helicase RecG [candidate division WOR-1 bacterium RIFOXYA2_FULL_46_56]